MNETSPDYQQAFVAAAIRLLNDDQLASIELRAVQICESSK